MISRRAILIHGVASSPRMWLDAGWPELLEDIGVTASTTTLPGHMGSALAPETEVSEVVDDIARVDPDADILIGFSAGACLALQTAASRPDQFRHVVVLGFGDRMWDRPTAGFTERLRAGHGPDARILRSLAAGSGNEIEHVAQFIEANPGPPSWSEMRAIQASVLVVLGADDGVGPADQVIAALPRADVITLPGVDHYRTPTSPAAMMAVLGFLAPGEEPQHY